VYNGFLHLPLFLFLAPVKPAKGFAGKVFPSRWLGQKQKGGRTGKTYAGPKKRCNKSFIPHPLTNPIVLETQKYNGKTKKAASWY
jgi:hypothetical protein